MGVASIIPMARLEVTLPRHASTTDFVKVQLFSCNILSFCLFAVAHKLLSGNSSHSYR